MKRIFFLATLIVSILTIGSFNNSDKAYTQTHRSVTKSHKPAKSTQPVINLPGWQKLANFNFPKLSPGKTTEEEFNKLYPFIKNVEHGDEDITIYTYIPDDKSTYSSVKFGFESNMLGWIDFVPGAKIKMFQVFTAFGTPLSINTKVSKYLNYYDFGALSVAGARVNDTVYTFTLSSPNVFNGNNAKEIGLKLPGWKSLNSGRFDKLIPGAIKKAELKKFYPGIKETSTEAAQSTRCAAGEIKDEYIVENNTSSYYLIDRGLEGSNYKKLVLVFKKDHLSWINIVPRYLSLAEVVKTFGRPAKIDRSSPNLDFYYFNNLVLTAAKNSDLVLNIGMLGTLNPRLRGALTSWKNINKTGVTGLVIDQTTEAEFRSLFSPLVAQKKTQGNYITYTVVEGLSTTDYESIDLVFVNKKLASIDLIPKVRITVPDIIKRYGIKYEVDNRTDPKYVYYTFDNVIVSVNRKTKMVSSIGII